MNNYDSNNSSTGIPPVSAPRRAGSLDIASLVCGILSVISCCTGIGSLIFGSLGILFAVLNRRKGIPMHGMSVAGLVLAIIGLILGICLIVYSVMLLLTDPYYYRYINEMYVELYGMDFAAFWEQ